MGDRDDLQRRIENLESAIEAINDRNARVEIDKKWETSAFRIGCIAGVTFAVSASVLWLIGVSAFLKSALLPAVGYILSTQSLPRVKQWWIERRISGN